MITELALIAYALTTIAPVGNAAPQMPAATTAARPQIEARWIPEQRAVANWRGEAAAHLDLDPAIAAGFAQGQDARAVSRCVKLNNYWCIKGLGWNGMLAADTEGHAAFASAPEGAAVAALLLRRYYLDFSRRSAQAIVSRWAPAQCGGTLIGAARGSSPVRTTRPGKRFGLAQGRLALGPAPRAVGAPLATRGLRNTLRGRYLAARGSGKRGAIRVSAIPDRTPPMLRTPVIAAGMGAMELALTPKSSLSLMLLTTRVTQASFAPMASCAGDSVRIRNYAMKMIEGVAASPDEDLKLFEPDGAPTGRLARVMLNMASVEIGPLKADPALIRTGIETASAAARAANEASLARAAAQSQAAPDQP